MEPGAELGPDPDPPVPGKTGRKMARGVPAGSPSGPFGVKEPPFPPPIHQPRPTRSPAEAAARPFENLGLNVRLIVILVPFFPDGAFSGDSPCFGVRHLGLQPL